MVTANHINCPTIVLYLECSVGAYATAFLSRKLSEPDERHFQLADRLITYVKDTSTKCVTFHKLNWRECQLSVVSDASHAATRDEFKSQTGYLIVLHDSKKTNLLAWKSSRQSKHAASSMAAECFAAQVAWQHGLYVRDLIKDFTPASKQTLKVNFVTDNDDLYKVIKSGNAKYPRTKA